jgi:hypothetical protein
MTHASTYPCASIAPSPGFVGAVILPNAEAYSAPAITCLNSGICALFLFDACHPRVVAHGPPAGLPDATQAADADAHLDRAARVARVQVTSENAATDCDDSPEQELDKLTYGFTPGLMK